MSLFKWPFKRKQYPNLENPRFIGDIVAANEAVLDAIQALAGLGSIDFAIISGMEYTAGSPGSYAPGIFYLNGGFYSMADSFSEGLYLIGVESDTMPQPFGDGNSRNIYTILQGQTSTSSAGASPVFSGNMNSYRLNLKVINSSLLSIQATLNLLKSPAFASFGTTAGTVAAGDDARFGYTRSDADNTFAKKVEVLLLSPDPAFTFTPSSDYMPATKKYVDDSQGFKLRWLGDISSDASVITKRTGDITVSVTHLATGQYLVTHNLGTTNFFVNGIGLATAAQLAGPRAIFDITANSFKVTVSDDASYNDAAFQLSICTY